MQDAIEIEGEKKEEKEQKREEKVSVWVVLNVKIKNAFYGLVQRQHKN